VRKAKLERRGRSNIRTKLQLNALPAFHRSADWKSMGFGGKSASLIAQWHS